MAPSQVAHSSRRQGFSRKCGNVRRKNLPVNHMSEDRVPSTWESLSNWQSEDCQAWTSLEGSSLLQLTCWLLWDVEVRVWIYLSFPTFWCSRTSILLCSPTRDTFKRMASVNACGALQTQSVPFSMSDFANFLPWFLLSLLFFKNQSGKHGSLCQAWRSSWVR